jgi:hypothetical protein
MKSNIYGNPRSDDEKTSLMRAVRPPEAKRWISTQARPWPPAGPHAEGVATNEMSLWHRPAARAPILPSHAPDVEQGLAAEGAGNGWSHPLGAANVDAGDCRGRAQWLGRGERRRPV